MGRRILGEGGHGRVTAVLASLALMAAISGCGSSDKAGAAPGSGKELTKVTLALLPLIDVAPAYLGVKKGFFKDAGLDVKIVTANGGAASLTGVVSGDYQFAYTGWTTVMQAQQAKVPVQAISNAQYQSETVDHSQVKRANQDVLVNANSPIKDTKGLEGKTVAVNALKGVQEIMLRNALEQANVNQSSVKLVEIPFPDMANALATERVDAVFISEPFETGVLDKGGRIVATPYIDTKYPAELSCYITSDQYRAQHEAIVTAFAKAMNKSLEYAQSNPDEARDIVTSYTTIPPELLKRVYLPYWNPEISKDSLEEQAGLTVKYGGLKELPDVDKLISTVVK